MRSRNLILTQNFRPGGFDPSGTHTLKYAPGTYRIPEDLSEEMAERAIKEANATWVADAEEPAPKKKMKGDAPENKARHK